MDKKIVNTQRAITPKVENPELRFKCSARRLMVFNVCVKFHENIRFLSYGADTKIVNRHTQTHTQRKDKNIIPPWHTSYAGGIIKVSKGEQR